MVQESSAKLVVEVEPSEEYIDFARKHIQVPRLSFRLGDAQVLPVESASYDAVVSGLVLNFVPQPTQALTCFRSQTSQRIKEKNIAV